MNRAIFRRRHHPLIWMAVLLPLLLGLDVLAWLLWAAWHLLPYVLAIGVAVVACKRWDLHLRALAWLRPSVPPSRPVVHGQVADDGAELAHLRGQVTRLENAANRPIEAIITSYERIGRQYAATGRTGDRR